MTQKATTFYASSNGDRWQLVRETEPACFVVRHEPNMASGGRPTDYPLDDFASQNSATPQGEALQTLLNKLLPDDPDLTE
jgi:hypothetical protein